MNNNADANGGGGVGNQNAEGNQEHQVRQEFFNKSVLTGILQIPQHLLQLIPRPRNVMFTMTERQIVSNESSRGYSL
jgi:hypothetical protein